RVVEVPREVQVQAGRQHPVGVPAKPEPRRETSQRRSGVGFDAHDGYWRRLPDALGQLLCGYTPVSARSVHVVAARDRWRRWAALFGGQHDEELTGMSPGTGGVVREDHDGSGLGIERRLWLDEAGR